MQFVINAALAVFGWPGSTRREIAKGYQMGATELWKRSRWLLQTQFDSEELGLVAAAVTNIASGSSRPETNKFEAIRARADEIWNLERLLVEQDVPFRELAVQTQRIALIDANLRHGLRPWQGKQSAGAVERAWSECAWFCEPPGTLATYGGQYPQSLNPKEYQAFCYRFWKSHESETLAT